MTHEVQTPATEIDGVVSPTSLEAALALAAQPGTRVVAGGPHGELMKREGLYRDLVAAQTAGQTDPSDHSGLAQLSGKG